MSARPLYLCSHWPEHGRQCKERAAGLMRAPDGDAVPGGHFCEPHAQAIIDEYAEKLHESWTLDRKAVEA